MDAIRPYTNDTALAAPTPQRDSTMHGEAALAAAAESAVQAVRVSAQIAQMRPRRSLDSRKALLDSCKRPMFAESAEYSFPRGKKRVTGPTVDLAREAARCWGNTQYGFIIVSSTPRETQIQGFAWDLESNVRILLEDRFQRTHQRVNEDTGDVEWVEPDERDFRELVNRRGAILVRNCLLQLLPPDLVDEALMACSVTRQAAAKGSLEKDRVTVVKDLVSAFDGFAVTTAMLEQFLGHPLDAIDPGEVDQLRTIYRSLKDGQAKRADFFAVPSVKSEDAPAGKARSLDDLGKKGKAKAKAEAPPPETAAAVEEREAALADPDDAAPMTEDDGSPEGAFFGTGR